MSELIRKKNYKLVTNSTVIIKELNEKRIFKELDNDLTKMYLDHLESEYTLGEIKLMKQTLENEISTKASMQTAFIAVLSVLVVIASAFMTNAINATTDLVRKGLLVAAADIVLIFYIVLIIIYFFWDQFRQGKRVKLLNQFNLILSLIKS